MGVNIIYIDKTQTSLRRKKPIMADIKLFVAYMLVLLANCEGIKTLSMPDV